MMHKLKALEAWPALPFCVLLSCSSVTSLSTSVLATSVLAKSVLSTSVLATSVLSTSGLATSVLSTSGLATSVLATSVVLTAKEKRDDVGEVAKSSKSAEKNPDSWLEVNCGDESTDSLVDSFAQKSAFERQCFGRNR